MTDGSARLRTTAELFIDLADRPEDLASLMLGIVFGQPWLDALSAEQFARLREQLTSPQPDGFRQQFRLVARADVRAELAAVTVPTLVVSTAQDMLVQPSQHRLAAELVPGARLVQLPSGHLPMVEALPELRDVMLDFLKS
ncbi:alpha/beta fold hydrolase [Kitasatospora brasiliensis]|uniref:alpha/beta fold hydrolase n=1 Tax=Kitasatospora brasiliensis TaxID=3058040 RepID=UPI002931C0CF|nr:alpha/beta fold hydrolase [Kitasatospora sp. K002]